MMAGMSETKVLIVKGLENRLYLIDFLPHLAETKPRRPIAVIGVNRIENQPVDRRPGGVP
jgi:hypothetical protein